MASQYFANFPEIQYEFANGQFATVKDLFRKARIDSSTIDSIINYTYYECQEGDRPDVVASRLYNDPDVYWTFFLVNDFLGSINDWWKDSRTFEAFIKTKYPGFAVNATNTTDIVAKTSKFALGEHCSFSGGAKGRICEVNPTMKRVIVVYDNIARGSASETLTGDISNKSFTVVSTTENRDAVHHYLETNGTWSNVNNDSNTAVSNIEYERDVNEEKRKIKVIEPRYIQRIVREFEDIISI